MFWSRSIYRYARSLRGAIHKRQSCIQCTCACHQKISQPIQSINSLQMTFPQLALNQRSFVTSSSFYANWKALSLQSGLLRGYLQHTLDCYVVTENQQMSGTASGTESLMTNEEMRLAQPLVDRMKSYLQSEAEIEELKTMIKELEGSDDMAVLAQQDITELENSMATLQEQLLQLLIPPERADNSDIILEINAGVGGQEARLFTMELLEMYTRFASWKGWTISEMDYEESELGGCRQATVLIGGDNVYRNLKYESGVHRVQRVPKTERSGRIHTSTATVAVMPQPSEIEVVINAKDLRIDTFRASGAGGQHVNKTDSAVRVTHLPTGMVSECQQNRSQIRNKALAMQFLRSKLYQKELDEQIKEERTNRKLQVGTAARSEKVRTYNFNQDRITDHRVGLTLYDLDSFFTGGELLEEVISALMEESGYERLQVILDQFEHKQNQAQKTKKR